MAFFKKNPNEAAFFEGKKHWVDVIKNTGSSDLLIFRQPEEDFNTNSTLIVMPGEEAIFVNGGIIERVFDSNTYKLSTENYPFISRLRNTLTGGISTFNCVVYFVRKADSKEILWGTDTPIQVRDKVFNIRTDVRARGAYKVRILNPSLFLEKLIGSNVPFSTQEQLNQYFAAEFQGRIKSVVSQFLNSLQHDLIGIDAYMDTLSSQITPFINESVSDYGLECVKFTLSGLDVDTTKYDTIDQSQIELISQTRVHQADRAGLDILGNDWGRVKGVEVLKDLANNPNSGGVAAAGAGMGMGIGAAGAFGSIAQQVFSPVNNLSGMQYQSESSQHMSSGRFTQKSTNMAEDTSKSKSVDDPAEVLMKLKKMLDAGLIEQSEYDAKKLEILSRL